jgi:hypothetical protein
LRRDTAWFRIFPTGLAKNFHPLHRPSSTTPHLSKKCFSENRPLSSTKVPKVHGVSVVTGGRYAFTHPSSTVSFIHRNTHIFSGIRVEDMVEEIFLHHILGPKQKNPADGGIPSL